MLTQTLKQRRPWLVSAALLAIVAGVFVARTAFARIVRNTIDPVALVNDKGRQLVLTGPIAITDGEKAVMRVTVTQRTTGAVADHLKEEMQLRLQKAGVEVVETRISHLAYAPEIAAAMLQRQQAGAIIAARTRIVEGAVGMVEMALTSLAHKGIVTLDEERKAAMVSNLLVVLCGERAAQPIVNAGTIHQ